jgi:hypothetical protein
VLTGFIWLRQGPVAVACGFHNSWVIPLLASQEGLFHRVMYPIVLAVWVSMWIYGSVHLYEMFHNSIKHEVNKKFTHLK